MHTLVSATHLTFADAVKVVLFFGAGILGISAGGTVWGLLGVASVLFSVWMATSTLDAAQRTKEIERLYHPSPNLLPAPASVTQRVTLPVPARVFERPPTDKLESVRG